MPEPIWQTVGDGSRTTSSPCPSTPVLGEGEGESEGEGEGWELEHRRLA